MSDFNLGFNFGSKADTLERLEDKLNLSKIPTFFHFDLGEWNTNKVSILQKISAMKKNNIDSVIIRSSAVNEDGEVFANAGAFLSIPHIDPSNKKNVEAAIIQVFNSYQSNENNTFPNQKDQILVQSMVQDISMSGVIFTHAMNNGAPYYVINYDDESGKTDTVTQGIGDSNRTLYISRSSWEELNSTRFINLIKAVNEIEEITNTSFLDIEFSLNNKLDVQIFQVRRITTQPSWSRGLSIKIEDAIHRIKGMVTPMLQSNKNSLNFTVFGKMPDWNPAEIIGNAPRHLAYSLYRLLITDKVWRLSRKLMGYYEPKGLPLMYSLGGQPFINVRNSFKSFIPHSIPEKISNKLVNYWLTKLIQNPHLHDKVEFEVAITCWTFSFDSRLKKNFLPKEFTPNEIELIKEGYFKITKDAIEENINSISSNLNTLDCLLNNHSSTLEKLNESNYLEIISSIIDDIIEKGTIPFSILARHAFIGKALLNSLVEINIISINDKKNIEASISTITSEFLTDLDLLSQDQISKAYFLKKYGHLRPGTYDILSNRYDQRQFTKSIKKRSKNIKPNTNFSLTKSQLVELNKIMKNSGFDINGSELIHYIKESSRARELSKFIFTKCLSDLLEIIAAWGKNTGLSREELSHLDIKEIMDNLNESSGRSIEEELRGISEKRSREYETTKAIRLPNLITRSSDLVIVPTLKDQPNFIGSQKVRGPIYFVSASNTEVTKLNGCILAIESADPGYDWIFTSNLLGLITKYGGANSHMAIRCSELQIPASIGCGDQIFERLDKFSYVELDCAVGAITPIH